MSLKEKIEQAANLKQMNALRMEVVEAKDAVILKLWQDKFWGIKKCPVCGHISYRYRTTELSGGGTDDQRK